MPSIYDLFAKAYIIDSTSIIAQIIGTIILISCKIAPIMKKKEAILGCQILVNSLLVMEFYLLDSRVGAIISAISAIRCIIFYLYKKHNLPPNIVILVFFIVLNFFTIFITWGSWIDIFILIAITSTYGMWQDNLKILRICTIIATASLSIYNFSIFAYTGALNEIIQFISTSIALVKHDIKKEE